MTPKQLPLNWTRKIAKAESALIRRKRLVGILFGAWTVRSVEETPSSKGAKALCECACGSTRWVLICNLKRGITRGCSVECSKKVREKESKGWLKGNDA